MERGKEVRRWEAAWRMARREEDKREQFSDKFDKVSRRIFFMIKVCSLMFTNFFPCTIQ